MVAPVVATPYTQQTMTLEEYLSLPLPDDRPEPEFVRDHLEERAMPDDAHAAVQNYLCYLALEAAKKSGSRVFTRTELRVKLSDSVIRVPDVLLYLKSPHKPGLITEPALAAFEIISPDDRWATLAEKVDEYVAWGAPYVFLIDPRLQRIYRCAAGSLQVTEVIEIPEIGLRATMTDLLENI